MSYHSASTSVHDSNQAEQDHEGRNQPYRYSGLVSVIVTGVLRKKGRINRSPSEDQVDRSVRTLKRKNR
jgi:hypothetical protein